MSATPEVQGKPVVSESALKEAPAINSTRPMPLQFRDDVRETNAEDGGKILILQRSYQSSLFNRVIYL